MSKKTETKAHYCEIPVAPEDIERFMKWINYYSMTSMRKRGTMYVIVGTDNILDLYWLGANMCANIPDNGVSKHKY